MDELLQELIDCIQKLPGIGSKSASRIAFFVLGAPNDEIRLLAQKLTEAKEKIGFCSICYNVTQSKVCSICQDLRRDDTMILVVEEAKDIIPVERTREYFGRYHVLGGSLNPMDEIGPEDLHIDELLERIKHNVKEVIIATNPTVTGEVTAQYLATKMQDMDLKVTRIALGLSMGSDLEYADELTLSRALEGRIGL
jgi:recombination protein RecR